MPTPFRSWKKSALCQLEWRPSRWQCAAHTLFAVLVPWAVLASGLTGPLRGPLATLACVLAAGQGLRCWRRPVCRILIPPDEDTAWVDGQAVTDLRLHDRGLLLQLDWRCQGCRHARLFWPDTLPAPLRRELRLAMQAHCISRSRPAVAP